MSDQVTITLDRDEAEYLANLLWFTPGGHGHIMDEIRRALDE